MKFNRLGRAKKVNISVTIDDDLYKWLLERVKERKFGNISQGIVFCIKYTQEEQDR